MNIGSTPISPSKIPIHRNRIYQVHLGVVKFHAADRSAWRPSSDAKIAVLRNADRLNPPFVPFAFSARATFRRRRTVKFSLILYLAVLICFARPKGSLSAVLKRRRSAFANRNLYRGFLIKFAQTERRNDRCEKRKRKWVDEPPLNGPGNKFKHKFRPYRRNRSD